MNNRVNYSLIGFLVLFGVAMMFGFGYWLLKPSKQDEMQRYFIYFDESVLGLNLDAPVKYKGIGVGKVIRLRINPENIEQVEVLIRVLKTTPIKRSTVAKLTSQGITGLSYINLSVGAKNDAILKAKDGEQYPVIKTIPSLFKKLESSFGNFSDNLSLILTKTQELLDDENQIQIALLLKNTASFMDKMNRVMDEKTIHNFQESMQNLNEGTNKLNVLIPKINEGANKLNALMPKIDILIDNSIEWEDHLSNSFVDITKSYIGISGAMLEFKKAVVRGDFNVNEITSDVMPTMNNTLLLVQQLILKMEEAIDKYERSPGDMLFLKEQIKKGPGEE